MKRQKAFSLLKGQSHFRSTISNISIGFVFFVAIVSQPEWCVTQGKAADCPGGGILRVISPLYFPSYPKVTRKGQSNH